MYDPGLVTHGFWFPFEVETFYSTMKIPTNKAYDHMLLSNWPDSSVSLFYKQIKPGNFGRGSLSKKFSLKHVKFKWIIIALIFTHKSAVVQNFKKGTRLMVLRFCGF